MLHLRDSKCFNQQACTSDWVQKHTIASVMPRQMPEPPPVQKSTFPLKMSGLNTAVEYTALVALDISTQ